MPDILKNPWRGIGLDCAPMRPIARADGVTALLAHCPAHHETPLLQSPDLAARLGVARVSIKDERARMGLGSFKALGAAHAIAREAEMTQTGDWSTALAGRTYVTASAGNHGLSVAAGARLFGARAVIYLSQTVPPAFAERLKTYGADVVIEGAHYEASMDAAQAAAHRNGWTLLSDSSWENYTDLPLRVMEGYTQLAAETVRQIDQPPTHILLQAGVGGLAAAIAAHARLAWGDAPQIIVVEPVAAPALIDSVKAGKPVTTTGPVSDMGRLDCKTPSIIALAGLSQDADLFVTITEDEAQTGLAELQKMGLNSTTSGSAGLTAALAGLPFPSNAHLLAILSEGPEA